LMYIFLVFLALMIHPGGWVGDIATAIGGGAALANMNILTFAMMFFAQGMDAAARVSQIVNPFTVFNGVLPGALDQIVRTLTTMVGLASPAGSLLLVLGLAILFTFFRLFFMLLTSYVSVLLAVIFAPFQLMLTALPGYEGGLGNWLRGLIANLAVFPATILMLGLASNLAGRGGREDVWVPPPISPGALAPAEGTVRAMIGFGILLLTPQVANMIKEALKVPAFKYGAAILAPIGTGFGLAKGYGAGRLTQHIAEQEATPEGASPRIRAVASFLKTTGMIKQ